MDIIGDIYSSLIQSLCRQLYHVRFGFFAIVSVISGTPSDCSTASYSLSLVEIMARNGINNENNYAYQCTIGAHRGSSLDHRENTLSALVAADQNDKYGFIEFDVQYSKDGVIVVYHDSRMLRLFGSLKAVGNTNYAELEEISGGEIVAYTDVINILQKRLNIEIKSQGDGLEDQRLVDEIIADLKNRKRTKDIMISSISGEVITYINRKYPDIPTGQVFWLTSSTYLPFDDLTLNLYDKIGQTKADYLILHLANLRNIDDLIKFKPKDKTLIFWDFDDNMFILHKDSSDILWGDSTEN